MMRSLFLLLWLVGAAMSRPATAQSPEAPAGDWNSERALELIQRAQRRRAEANADTGLINYQADARLYVYFYLDRQDTGQRNLVKTDQLALEVFWQSPNLVKQRIVGWRNEKSLPTNIRYHLDHLTVVQENFGDEIRLGDGDEVRGVPHPAAPQSQLFYEYRLADSLTLRLPGAPEPVRVYELQVRPRDPGQPAFVGSVFIDRRENDLVRMDFTFTSASYVDRYLDYINISLDNGLWRGRFWLPNQQRVEIRRRIPQLDIPAGSVIRANMRIGGYQFNQPLPPTTFVGPAVVAAPQQEREAFPFEQELHAEVREQGIGPEAELGEIRRQAARLAREQVLRRVEGVRLGASRASEILRYNRAEGLALGLGLSVAPLPDLRLRAVGGYAFGAGHPVTSLSLTAGTATRLQGSVYANRPRDVGVGPVASGAANTISSLFAAQDYSEPYFASGGSVEVQRALSSSWSAAVGGRFEWHESAERSAGFSLFGGEFREVRPVDETRVTAASLRLRRRAPAGTAGAWEGRAQLELGAAEAIQPYCPAGRVDCGIVDPRAAFAKLEAATTLTRRWSARDAEVELDGGAGIAAGRLPRQELYLIGGKGTVPGYGFRAFGGDRYALARLTGSADLWRPWVRGRLLGALGWAAEGGAAEDALGLWGAMETGAVKPSVGVGVGLLHDILRVDLSRGLGAGGRWELTVEAQPTFWDFL